MLSAQITFSLDARLVSAEIYIQLQPNAKAVISHALVWDVRSGTMGGFYFQGEEAPFVWDTDRCWADLQDGTRSKLDIKKLQGKWDILLAEGKRVAGKTTWVLTYGADLAAAGMFGTTTAENGERLFYFHWAPSRWDNDMDHRTITIILPFKINKGESGNALSDRLQSLGFKTEKFVSDENKIDFFATEGSDDDYLALRFHQDTVPSRKSQELQFYFSEDKLASAFSEFISRSTDFMLIENKGKTSVSSHNATYTTSCALSLHGNCWPGNCAVLKKSSRFSRCCGEGRRYCLGR